MESELFWGQKSKQTLLCPVSSKSKLTSCRVRGEQQGAQEGGWRSENLLIWLTWFVDIPVLHQIGPINICYSGGARGQDPWYYHFSEICIWWGSVVGVQSNVHHRQQQFSCPSRLTSDAQSDAPVSLHYPTRLVTQVKLSGKIFNDSEGSLLCQFHRAVQLLSYMGDTKHQ